MRFTMYSRNSPPVQLGVQSSKNRIVAVVELGILVLVLFEQ